MLGYFYYLGIGVEKNENQGFKLIGKAVRQGSGLGKYVLGYLYEFGIGVVKDLELAVKIYQNAAAHHYLPARMRLIVFRRDFAVEKFDATQYLQDLLKLRKADEHAFGYLSGNYYLGLCCADGIGTVKDPKKAVEFFQKGAVQGCRLAKYALAKNYFNPLNKDSKPFDLFDVASEKSPLAKFTLGLLYLKGHGDSMIQRNPCDFKNGLLSIQQAAFYRVPEAVRALMMNDIDKLLSDTLYERPVSERTISRKFR